MTPQNTLPFDYQMVGIPAGLEYLDDFVMTGMCRSVLKKLWVPVMNASGAVVGREQLIAAIPQDFGANSFFDEDLIISKGLPVDVLLNSDLKSSYGFDIQPINGGYIADFGGHQYWLRKAKAKEFSSIHPYLVREGDVIVNHTFIQREFYADWLAKNPLSQWRMPFSPNSASSLAVSWYMLDAQGYRWECVAPNQQDFSILRKKHYALSSDNNSSFVGIKEAENPGYDDANHVFFVTPGCKIVMVFINSPLGAKEWETQVTIDPFTSEISYKQ